MQALLVVDAQNEFSPTGRRAVVGHPAILARIEARVAEARRDRRPIAWVQHHNLPDEWPALEPRSWGAELSPGFGPRSGFGEERLFQKDVFGAFGAPGLEAWLRDLRVDSLLVMGFFAHMCVSTSCRQGLMRGYAVSIDPEAVGSRDLSSSVLGRLSAAEVVRTALLHLVDMGATLASAPVADPVTGAVPRHLGLAAGRLLDPTR